MRRQGLLDEGRAGARKTKDEDRLGNVAARRGARLGYALFILRLLTFSRFDLCESAPRANEGPGDALATRFAPRLARVIKRYSLRAFDAALEASTYEVASEIIRASEKS